MVFFKGKKFILNSLKTKIFSFAISVSNNEERGKDGQNNINDIETLKKTNRRLLYEYNNNEADISI